MILIKDNFIKDKMLIEEAEIRGGGGENPQGYTMEINDLIPVSSTKHQCMETRDSLAAPMHKRE